MMGYAETWRRRDICAYSFLQEVYEQGIEGWAVTISLPIDQPYSIPASHRIRVIRFSKGT